MLQVSGALKYATIRQGISLKLKAVNEPEEITTTKTKKNWLEIFWPGFVSHAHSYTPPLFTALMKTMWGKKKNIQNYKVKNIAEQKKAQSCSFCYKALP